MIYLFYTLLVIFIGYLIYKAYKNTHDIKINNIKITPDTESEQGDFLSILHLSDLHLENISFTSEQLSQTLANKSIDLIVLTGDFLDRKRTIPKLIPYLKVLQKIQPKYGIYAVLGNHDYVLKKDDLNKLTKIMADHDCHILQNDSKTITINGNLINIIGIDDYSTKRSNLPRAFQQVNAGMNIVITHDPTIVLEMEDYRFDYLMAGHFHGGQICYPKAYHLVKMGKLARKNIIKGLHKHNDSPFYISEGLGQTGLNIRVGSRPEITFHDVSVQSKAS
ncbi:metallophosphoesterase [Virgibacillus alimentarius]|uniref:MPP superfamily phosphohydrolase n=1 Tax=Virgibacillus alimentarius TaxID=698769 RepID=A0ABS4S5X2_9BACI|nr:MULTISPECIES: metallophosphoesterase [Virgibacillus]MBP2256809.1 putative MPP superfamily phosphohydrolase [Virgibacillus alimentarius]HLR65678.1 metallophosphoesterase [Virgibacillus sp.]